MNFNSQQRVAYLDQIAQAVIEDLGLMRRVRLENGESGGLPEQALVDLIFEIEVALGRVQAPSGIDPAVPIAAFINVRPKDAPVDGYKVTLVASVQPSPTLRPAAQEPPVAWDADDQRCHEAEGALEDEILGDA
jgi:hypothetical protein